MKTNYEKMYFEAGWNTRLMDIPITDLMKWDASEPTATWFRAWEAGWRIADVGARAGEVEKKLPRKFV